MTIGILGSGAWGTALSCMLSEKNDKIIIWSNEKQTAQQINNLRINKVYLPNIRIPKNVIATNNLEDLKLCKFIFICVPSQFIKKITSKLDEKFCDGLIFFAGTA